MIIVESIAGCKILVNMLSSHRILPLASRLMATS